MTNIRDRFLAQCVLSDVDTLQTTRAWHCVECYSCDFCDSFCTKVGRCAGCQRWLGLADCECAATSSSSTTADDLSRRSTPLEPQRDQPFVVPTPLQVIDRACQRRCQWCVAAADNNTDAKEAPPEPCGRVGGLLSRVVFVLEPTQTGRWQYALGQRLLTNLREALLPGSFLLYSFHCGDADLDWSAAFDHVRKFAAKPHLFLPQRCRLDPRGCSIIVVQGVHSARRTNERNSVSLELGETRQHTLEWWTEQWCQQLLVDQRCSRSENNGDNDDHDDNGDDETKQEQPSFHIDDLYLLSCDLFPDGGVGARNERLFRSVADQYGVTIMACDGFARPYLQVFFVVLFETTQRIPEWNNTRHRNSLLLLTRVSFRNRSLKSRPTLKRRPIDMKTYAYHARCAAFNRKEFFVYIEELVLAFD